MLSKFLFEQKFRLSVEVYDAVNCPLLPIQLSSGFSAIRVFRNQAMPEMADKDPLSCVETFES